MQTQQNVFSVYYFAVLALSMTLRPSSNHNHCLGMKQSRPIVSNLNPRFSDTGHEDKTAVQLMSEYDSLPAVCNCCSTLVNPDRTEDEERGEERSREPGVQAAA